MIVHIFTANRYHLVPDIAIDYIRNYNQFEHVVILYGDKKTDKKLYTNIFERLEFRNYHFCTNTKTYIRLLKKYKERSILFHAGNYSWFLFAIFLGCKNINWICWGAGASISKSIKSKLFTPVKKFIYNSFKSIVVLMDPDARTIVKDFKVPPHNIRTISYENRNEPLVENFYIKNITEGRNQNLKPLVLLGNNSSCMNDYISMLDLLKPYSGMILVQCMLHYSLKKNETYQALTKKGELFFGSDFKTNEEFYSKRADYINYMNRCDVYICAALKQTGLHAIDTTLRLGKKIYLNGKNYEWITSKGIKVNHVNDIFQMTIKEFIEPLSVKEKLSNFERIKEGSKINLLRWIEFFKELELQQDE